MFIVIVFSYRLKVEQHHFTDYEGEFQFSPEKISPQPRPSAWNDLEVKFRLFMTKWPAVVLSAPPVKQLSSFDEDNFATNDTSNESFVTPAKRAKK